MLKFYDWTRVIHSFKTALACVIGFIITKSIHLPVDQWLTITIIVVMCAQINVGSMIQKSYMRFLGTLIGSLFAAIILFTAAHNNFAIGAALAISTIIFSYLATSKTTINEAGTLGAVTVVIILIGNNPTLMTAAGRCLEISIGIIVAALVSQFIFPIHARNLLQQKQILLLRQLRTYYLASLSIDERENGKFTNHYPEEEMINSFITQRKLASEAARELFAKNNLVVNRFNQLLTGEREILRSISLIHYIYNHSPESKKFLSDVELTHEFHDKICNMLDKISLALSKKNPDYDSNKDMPNISVIKMAIQKYKNTGSENTIIYLDSFLLCAKILIDRLDEMIKLTV